MPAGAIPPPAPGPRDGLFPVNSPVSMSRTRWPAVATVVAAGVVAAAGVGKLPPALPVLARELSLDLIASGWLASVFNTVGTFAALAVGIVSARMMPRRLALAGLFLLVSGGLAGAVSTGAPMLFTARVFEGAGFLGVVIAGPALIIAATAPRDRPLALGYWSTYMPTGMALALAGAPWVIERSGWRGLWFAVAAAGLLCAVLLARQHRAQPAPEPKVGMPPTGLADTLRRPRLWLLALVFGLYAAQWATLMVWLPTFLAERVGLTSVEAALATCAVVMFNIPGNLLGARRVHRGTQPARVIMIASVAMALAELVVFADTVPAPVRLAAAAVFSLCGGMLPAAVLATGPLLAARGEHVGLASAVLMQGSNCGQFFGPPAAALVAASHGWAEVGILLAAVGLCALACGAGLGAGVPAKQHAGEASRASPRP